MAADAKGNRIDIVRPTILESPIAKHGTYQLVVDVDGRVAGWAPLTFTVHDELFAVLPDAQPD